MLNATPIIDYGGYDLSEFNQSQMDFINALVKLAYNKGLSDGQAEAKQTLIEIYAKLNEKD